MCVKLITNPCDTEETPLLKIWDGIVLLKHPSL